MTVPLFKTAAVTFSTYKKLIKFSHKWVRMVRYYPLKGGSVVGEPSDYYAAGSKLQLRKKVLP